jgi:ectoine hydroxylase-related dioxygenase (phytanoyl-CoA dioxygenase family)
MSDISNFFKKHGYYQGPSKFSVDLINDFKQEFDSVFNDKRQRFYAKFKEGNQLAANHDMNRWNMLLPSDSLMMKSAFFADNEIFDALKAVFDKDFALVFFSSDISSPGSAFQSCHQDTNDFGVALNLPLVKADEQNGATHIFTDTHRISADAPFTNESNKFSEEAVIARANSLNPLSLNVEPGDFTLRDLRLIHRGTPNHTLEHRPYLSSIFLPASKNEAPNFETIRYGLETFDQFKKEAFPSGRTDLIDYANTFGRLIIVSANSDRVNRPIPAHISNQLNENALYCFRFAFFEDQRLNKRIERTAALSEKLRADIELAKLEFYNLKSTYASS